MAAPEALPVEEPPAAGCEVDPDDPEGAAVPLPLAGADVVALGAFAPEPPMWPPV
ncbi:MAG: hypothetical protein ACTHLP_16615 [Rhizobiaceae bacterium]